MHEITQVLLCTFADRKAIVVGNQIAQSEKRPVEDTICFRTQLFCKVRIVNTVGITFLRGQNDLTAEEASTAVIECLQKTIKRT